MYNASQTALRDTAWVYITIGNPDAVPALNLNNELVVYPNPAKGKINIDCMNTSSEKVGISLISAGGKRMLTESFSVLPGQNTMSLNIEDIPSGIYFIRLKTENEIIYKKIIVN